MLSFGHALYFGAGAYGLGIVLENTGIPLFPGILIALVGGLAIALVTGAVSRHDSGTNATPALAHAKKATTWSIELPDTVAIRSPGP